MSYKNTMANVAQLVLDEYEMAKEEHGKKFSSMHEGYAVLLEEIEEARTEMDAVMNDAHLRYLWESVKEDNAEHAWTRRTSSGRELHALLARLSRYRQWQQSSLCLLPERRSNERAKAI